MTDLADASVDLILTSPPFLGVRTYLPDDHNAKALEIGAEATPAEYLTTLLELTAEWGRLLTDHGSLVVELGDVYAGRSRARRGHDPGRLRHTQQSFSGASTHSRLQRTYGHVRRDDMATPIINRNGNVQAGGPGWPLDKSLCGIPGLYAWSLAYGHNLLTGEPSPAGRWRIRNLKPWIRTNPPAGALSDKERPATSYVIVATRTRARYFDLDAVRHHSPRSGEVSSNINDRHAAAGRHPGTNPSGAPPLDWWHHVDGVLDAALRQHAGGHTHPRTARGVHRRPNRGKAAAGRRGGNWASLDIEHKGAAGGIRGWHLRRALEDAGILTTLDAVAINAAGYPGSHYAVWPDELVRVLVEEMCPRRVCRTCGEPSRRVVESQRTLDGEPADLAATNVAERLGEGATGVGHWRKATQRTTVGWSTCGCPDTDPDSLDGFHTGRGWRAGRVTDPFAGSGTTLQVAASLGRNVVGIDLDPRNVELVRERCGPTLTVDETTADDTGTTSS